MIEGTLTKTLQVQKHLLSSSKVDIKRLQRLVRKLNVKEHRSFPEELGALTEAVLAALETAPLV